MTWAIRFRRDGRETTQSFARKADANRFARWLNTVGSDEAVRLLAEAQGSVGAEHTVASWCTDHVDHLTGVTVGTIARYRMYIANDLGALADLPLSALTPRTVGVWVKALQDGGNSGKTIRNKHGFVSGALNAAVTAGVVPANPCRGMRLPTTITPPMVFLTQAEYARFVRCFTPERQPLVHVLFFTGLRWGEVTALQAGDIDLAAGTITITRSWKEARGQQVLGAPKSRKGRRTIAIAPATVEVLRPVLRGKAPTDWVFTNHTGGPARPATFHTWAWRPAVRLANGESSQRPGHPHDSIPRDTDGAALPPLSPPLGKRPRIHDARHSCASWLLGAGIPLNVVQHHLGHESITTTSDRYGHLLPSAQAYVRDALTAAFNPAAG